MGACSSAAKIEGWALTCGQQRRSPLEQGGLEVPCELAFSGTKQLTKNVRVHVRTITLGRMSTHASRSKGEGWALTRAWALTQQNTVYTYCMHNTCLVDNA